MDETANMQAESTDPVEPPPYVYDGSSDYPDVPPPPLPVARRCVSPAGYEVQCEPQG
ncbi:hypothetical protein ABT369_38915 [Dactylosporangium sp. NPDC000244]|uniref:hypothetical protein n=1 Tax=Dactylosporangium sp. NPDC000244 TaxID=3154365 RepID=UPI0033270D8B